MDDDKRIEKALNKLDKNTLVGITKSFMMSFITMRKHLITDKMDNEERKIVNSTMEVISKAIQDV